MTRKAWELFLLRCDEMDLGAHGWDLGKRPDGPAGIIIF